MKQKEELYRLCNDYVDKRFETVQEIISSNQNALQSEAKSSAGDKHETGRAMLQLEMEKAGQQLLDISLMKDILAKVDLSKASKNVHLGSIVSTNTGHFFLSIAAGKFTIEGVDYYAISVSSPIGKLLLGKQENEEFFLNGKQIKITKIG